MRFTVSLRYWADFANENAVLFLSTRLCGVVRQFKEINLMDHEFRHSGMFLAGMTVGVSEPLR